MSRLLVRDLAQLVSPAGSGAPLRGHELGKVEIVTDAYVLCEEGRIAATGAMRDLPAGLGDLDELDARGLVAIPGLVDCHTHACFAGDRVDEFALRAAGATYEELHAAGGGILSTVRATRAAGEELLAEAVRRHRGWMLSAGTTTFEAKSGYGLDRDTELAQLRAIRAAGGIPTWLGAHAVPPEHPDADRYLDFALAEVLPEAAQIAEAADVFLERGAFDAVQARRYLTGAATPGWRSACTAISSPSRGRSRSRSSSGRARSTTSRRQAQTGSPRWPRATSPGCCSRRALSSSTARCRLRGRSSTPARPSPSRPTSTPGARSARASRSSARSPRPSSASTRPRPWQPSTVNAAHVLGRADRKGRIAPGYDADLALLDAPDWRYLAYHLGHDHVAAVVLAGERAELG